MPPKKLSFSQNALWNTGGCIWYNLCLWGITMVVVRLSADYENAGQLQLALTITNVFALVASYNLKTYMVSDMEGVITAGEYFGAQITASLLGTVLCAGYVLLCGYSPATCGCILAYMLFRVVGTWSEICMGVEQRHERMDYVGISNLLRGTLLLVFFGVVLRLTDSVTVASLAMAVSSLGVLLLYDRRMARQYENVRPVFRRSVILPLLKKCAPMVISMAAFAAVVTIPRQYLSAHSGTSALGYYATVATPVVVIQVLVTGIFDPVLRSASESYDARDLSRLKVLALRLLVILSAVSVLAFAGAHFLGEWALVLLYGESIRAYSYLLLPVVGCAVLYCLCWIVSTMLVIMRRLKTQMVLSLLALGAAACLRAFCVKTWALNGVSFAVMAAYGLYLLLGAVLILRQLRRDNP